MSDNETIRFIDFFAGIGGFRRGMELAGHKCVGFCEFDKFATASYTSMHLITDAQREYLKSLDFKKRQAEILKEDYRNGEWYAADIREVKGEDLPDAECWCFGAPCQSFSVAGHRAGLEGQSGLVREIFRLLGEVKEESRPEWLIYENVKGMLSSNKGCDFLAILLAMDGYGYDIRWQNINSAWFIPQNRERIYTIGHLRRCGRAEVLPVKGTDGENSIKQIGHYTGSGIDNPIPYRVHDTDGICPTISATGGGGTEPHIVEPCFCDLNYGAGIHETDVSRCLSARDYKGISLRNAAMSGVMHTVKEDERVVIPVLTPDRIHKRQNGRRFKENKEPMFTLTAQDQHGVGVELDINEEFFDTLKPGTVFVDGNENAIGAVSDGKAVHDGLYAQLSEDLIVYAIWYEKYQCYITIRRLTPKECFRLQGWTDDYFEKAAFVNSDSQLYKQAGNGVTVLVVEAVANRIKEAIKKMKLHNQLDDELEQLWQEFNKKKDVDDVPKSGTFLV